MSIDMIDRKILGVLQRKGRIPNNELAEEVGLSPSPCLRRVRNMEDTRVIKRYVALVDATKVGMGMTVFARVYLSSQSEEIVGAFIKEVEKLSQVVECHLMAGDYDFLLRIVAPDLEGYRFLQTRRLASIAGVASIKTDIPMQQIKVTSEVPLDNI